MSDKQNQALAPMQVFKKTLQTHFPRFWGVKATYLNEQAERYLERTMIEIGQNQGCLEILNTQEGRISLLMCIENALRLGLTPGGFRKHFYIVPFRTNGVKKAVLIPTIDGLLSVVMTPPEVIKDLTIGIVRDGDPSFTVDMAAGILKHPCGTEVFETDRPIKGFYAIVTPLTGKDKITLMSKAEMDAVRDKVNAKNRGESTFWKDYYLDMAKKTIGKKALKPYIAQKERYVVDYDDKVTGSIDTPDYDDLPVDERIVSGIEQADEELEKVQELKATDDQVQREIF